MPAAALAAAQQPVAPPPPGWERAPAGYNFRAMDSDGRWSWFKRRPYTETLGDYDGWDDIDGVHQARGLAYYPGWQETVSERPDTAQAEEAA